MSGNSILFLVFVGGGLLVLGIAGIIFDAKDRRGRR
jgi:hypothetical protein